MSEEDQVVVDKIVQGDLMNEIQILGDVEDFLQSQEEIVKQLDGIFGEGHEEK